MGDRSGEGSAYGNLGNAYDSLGDFNTALKHHKHNLEIAEEVEDRVGEGSAHGNLGNAYYSLGDFKTAIKHHEHRLKIVKEVGDRVGEGGTFGNLGNAYWSLGDFKKAIDYHERDLKIAQEVGNRVAEESAYGNLGNAYHSLGNFRTAIEYHERHLKIAKEVGDRPGEGRAYGNLGIAHHKLGDFKTAIDFHKRDLEIANEVGDRVGERKAYGNLGTAHYRLGDFKTAIDYYERDLNIAKEVGDILGEGSAFGNLGNAYNSLGDFKTAITYHKHDLQIAQKVGDRSAEGMASANLGNALVNLGDFETAVHYHECDLEICKEVGDRAGEGRAYANIGNVYYRLGDFKRAVDYYERDLEIAKEVGDIFGEGRAYCNIGNVQHSLGEFQTAITNHEHHLKISKEVGDKVGVAKSFYNLGHCFESISSTKDAIEYYNSSVTMLNDVRENLQMNDEWKISLRNFYQIVYTSLWRLLLNQGKIVEALFSAEQGRAQALKDLIEMKYAPETTCIGLETDKGTIHDMLSCLPSNTVFIAIEKQEVIFWVCQKGKDVELRRKKISNNSSGDDVTTFFQSIMEAAYQEIDARADVKCEDRSLDKKREENLANEGSTPEKTPTQYLNLQKSALTTLFDTIISPIQDLLLGNELVFVPEGTLCLASFAAFMDWNSKYLCESYRIRLIPSLTSLKLIADCPEGYHSSTGVLPVGDPWVQEATNLQQLPCAKEEVQMIGRIIGITPLIGRQATKDEVLKRLPSVALVQIAAHGRMETGEIALSPNPKRKSQVPVEEDFILTMKDVLAVQMRARLVVLSCCHSAHGDIKAEGVVGIARAFLGAGARSVLVSLWAIDDEATMEFMKSFYLHLVKGKCASEALNQAMKCMRESDEFSAVKYWAPFVLIGDDVTLEFGGGQ